ncbi:metal-dependent transcriptional regulator [Rubritalea marina]|uniref:metal-dependent transcriptional regulator n=1 Tax=Rubritalea marina TaxID=361055 RepID=UPI00047732A5|nr:iron dependent repressor, metal binding and dimerization domain protein [Rubritalea marina]
MSDESKHRAAIHERVRQQHSSELAQDYVEAIHEILEGGSAVTISALQKVFGVSHVTVIRTLQRLQEQGLISGTKSKEISLTNEGRQVAERAIEKHALLKRFFEALGVSDTQADADAEGAEHHLSEETLEAIRRFLEQQG